MANSPRPTTFKRLPVRERRIVDALDVAEDFGNVDAEQDELLDTVFEDHDAYKSALAHKRFVIVGRKGSGKTAIYRRIVGAESHAHFALGHTFADYPWHHHHVQATGPARDEQRFFQSWLYLVVCVTLCTSGRGQPA